MIGACDRADTPGGVLIASRVGRFAPCCERQASVAAIHTHTKE